VRRSRPSPNCGGQRGEEFTPFLAYDVEIRRVLWKPALNAFAVTFADRMPAAENL